MDLEKTTNIPLRYRLKDTGQRFLQQQSQLGEYHIIEDIQETAKTLKQLVTFLKEEGKNHDQAINDILLSNHPAFKQLKDLTNTSYRIFFINKHEMIAWLTVKGYVKNLKEDNEYEIFKSRKNTLKIFKEIFDETGKLKIFTVDNWNENWIEMIKDENQDLDDYYIPNFIQELDKRKNKSFL